MHAGNWIALLALCLLGAAIVAAAVRRRAEAGPKRHGPPVGDQRPDGEALAAIGKVAADGARSASG